MASISVSDYLPSDRSSARASRRPCNDAALLAVEVGEVMAQVAQIKTLINAAQKVIGGDVIFKGE